jgi:Uncharacterised nucleotidyltransferase
MERLRQLSAALVDDEALAACASDPAAQRDVWELAVAQMVHLVLAWRIVHDPRGSWSGEWPSIARAALADGAVVDELQRRDLVRAVAAFADAGVDALLLKGAAWAHLLYADPVLRPRRDADVLVDRPALDAADRVLRSLGYETPPAHTKELVTAQRTYRRVDGLQLAHQIDLHWRVTNPLVFADALLFARLWPRRVRIDALGGAWTLGPADALLLACLHRLAHHGDRPELLWLMDIDRLAARLHADEWSDLVAQAELNGLRGVCALGLARASDWFHTGVPAHVRAALEADTAGAPDAIFLQPQIDPLGVLASDWRALHSWRDRLRLALAHVFPAPAYIRARYGLRHPVWLPFLYAHRALGGLSRWIVNAR